MARGHRPSNYQMTADATNTCEFASRADSLRDPRQEFQNFLPTRLAFLLKGHNSLMKQISVHEAKAIGLSDPSAMMCDSTAPTPYGEESQAISNGLCSS